MWQVDVITTEGRRIPHWSDPTHKGAMREVRGLIAMGLPRTRIRLHFVDGPSTKYVVKSKKRKR